MVAPPSTYHKRAYEWLRPLLTAIETALRNNEELSSWRIESKDAVFPAHPRFFRRGSRGGLSVER